MPALYLASRSPRRAELLRQIGLTDFEVLLDAPPAPLAPGAAPGGTAPADDELQHPGEPAAEYVERIARDKALAGLRRMTARALPIAPVLGADTIVVLDGTVLGKPADAAQAADFLRRLSGRTHEVRTAVVIAQGTPAAPQLLQATSVSAVTLRALSPDEIAHYCASGEPLDKAGGYGIQGRAAIFVAHLAGSHSGVAGLPLCETALLLRAAGVPVP